MELLSIGINHIIVDAVIRALPSKSSRIFVTAVSATSLDISNTSDMSNPKNITATNPSFNEGGSPIAAGFIRINGGTAIVRLE